MPNRMVPIEVTLTRVVWFVCPEEHIVKAKSILGCVVALALVVGSVALIGCSKTVAQKPTPAEKPRPSPEETKVPTVATSQFKVGHSVAAKWADGNLWLAVVVSVQGDDTVTVQFEDDHSRLTLRPADVHVIDDQASWAVGSDVLAAWDSGRFYPGRITGSSGTTYTVKWDDGSEPSQVPAYMILSPP